MKRMHTDREIYSMADKKAKQRIEAGLTENAKPIYVHPLEIGLADTLLLTALVMNNENTEIDSFDKLKAAIIGFGNVDGYARLHVSGSMYISASTYNVCEIVYNFTTEKFLALFMNSSGQFTTEDITDLVGVSVVDSVNKIN